MIATTTLIILINSVRKTPLMINPKITKVAEVRCQEMTEWSHKNYEYYLNKVFDFGYRSGGENLALGFNDAQTMFAAFQNSPTHRAIEESETYTEVGVANCKNKNLQGDVTVVLFAGKK